MIVFFIILAVIAALCLLVFLLLAAPVRLETVYRNGKLALRLKYLFYLYSEYSSDEEEEPLDAKELMKQLKKRKKRRKKKQKAERKSALAKAAGTSREPETIKEVFEVLLSLVRDVLMPIIRAEKFRIFIKKLKVSIGSAQAADTAVICGAVTASANVFIGFLYENCRVRFGRKKDRFILPRYDRDTVDADINVVFSMSLFHVLTSVLPELSKHVEL